MAEFTRAELAKMTPAEYAANRDEIARWLAAGAVDGAEVAPTVRPAGHEFTRAEVAKMTPAEYAANRDEIHRQTRTGELAARP